MPAVALGDNFGDGEAQRHMEAFQNKGGHIPFCNGILENKDLIDNAVQDGIQACLQYTAEPDFNRGTSSLYSIFCEKCTQSQETVRLVNSLICITFKYYDI